MKPDLYSFVFRGLLAEQNLSATLRTHGYESADSIERSKIEAALPFQEIDGRAFTPSDAMSPVFAAISSAERMMRRYISETLADAHGSDWWVKCVSEQTRRKADKRISDEQRIKYHGARGAAPIHYADFGDLAKIIKLNWADFEDFLPSQDWVAHISDSLENSRNVIMHSGDLDLIDVERVGMNIRDWIRQTGT